MRHTVDISLYLSNIYYCWTDPFPDTGRFIRFNYNICLKIQCLPFSCPAARSWRAKTSFFSPRRLESLPFFHGQGARCGHHKGASAKRKGAQFSGDKVFTLEKISDIPLWPDPILLLGEGKGKARGRRLFPSGRTSLSHISKWANRPELI